MSKNNFYTFEELKDFTDNFTDLTIINVTKFIEIKTDKKHTVIERQLVCDLNKQLFNNITAVFEIQRFLNKIWSEVTEKNNITVSRWKEQLKPYDS